MASISINIAEVEDVNVTVEVNASPVMVESDSDRVLSGLLESMARKHAEVIASAMGHREERQWQ